MRQRGLRHFQENYCDSCMAGPEGSKAEVGKMSEETVVAVAQVREEDSPKEARAAGIREGRPFRFRRKAGEPC